MRPILLLVLLAAPAAACLNDREVVERDRRFRAGYGEAPVAAAAVPGTGSAVPPWVLIAVPLALAAVGAALSLRKPRR
jgi:hypothetical protein